MSAGVYPSREAKYAFPPSPEPGRSFSLSATQSASAAGEFFEDVGLDHEGCLNSKRGARSRRQLAEERLEQGQSF